MLSAFRGQCETLYGRWQGDSLLLGARSRVPSAATCTKIPRLCFQDACETHLPAVRYALLCPHQNGILEA